MSQSQWKRRDLWLVVAIILWGASLRWAQLSAMTDMLNSDEAANGLDALSLIQSPRLVPFFSSYTGRESGWHYWLMPFLLAFGLRPLAIRLAATMIGILTLAAMYSLSKELLPRRAAVWTTAVLAILYWHIHFSQIGFRAILLPLLGALAMGLLLRAQRTNKLKVWLGAGIMLGLLAYTYFSARMWLGYAGLMLVYGAVREPQKRRGIVLAGGVTAVLALPLFLYTYFHPADSLGRIGEVSVLTVMGVINNGLAWLAAWFQLGDQNVMLNLPGRPILDWFLAIPFLVGLAGLWWAVKERWHSLWLVGLAILAALPSLLSDHAPHFLRAIGLVIPIAMIAGTGVYVLERFIQRYAGRIAVVLPLIWLLAAGIDVYETMATQWLNDPDLYEQMEVPLNEAASFIEAATPTDMPVYFVPLSRLRPTFLFQAAALAPRHVAAFASDACWVKTAVPALYVFLDENPSMYFQDWATTQIVQQGNGGEYLILSAMPNRLTSTSESIAIFGNALQVEPTDSLPHQISPGETVLIDLDFQALQPTNGEYKLFIHLYGTPSPYEGGPIWAQTDSPICPSYPMTLWQPFEMIQQQFPLALPADLPPGEYSIVIGLYTLDDGFRLSLTAPATNEWNHFELARMKVAEPEK
jgi:4-amino-4-deoxy-L-arabinose transferase-like glycosyltransferase